MQLFSLRIQLRGLAIGLKGCLDECDWNWRWADGFSDRDGPVLLLSNAMVASSNGGLCGAKNVPGVRIDYSTIEAGMHGVRENLHPESRGQASVGA